jgi:SAM-dependent methyltransferase
MIVPSHLSCPFCRTDGKEVFRVRYQETAERNAQIGDFEGAIRACEQCGIAYSDCGFDPAEFTQLYSKSLNNLVHFDDSGIQKVRNRFIGGFIKRQGRGPISQALQIPLHSSVPKTMLDVGCGFGEFAKAYRGMGATVEGTEVIPQLVERARKAGILCHLGELSELKLAGQFELILFRAVLYRTSDPTATLNAARAALAKGGHISIVDPCTDAAGLRYFAFKQFPQGRYYITDFGRYSAMLVERFGLKTVAMRQYYGRSNAALRKVRFWGNISGFAELAYNNLTGRKPYTAAYLLATA